MKSVVLMVFTGIALFLGAMVGLLGAQGRLTYEGTRNIPILSRLFSKPPQDLDDSGGAPTGDNGKTADGGIASPGVGDGPSIVRQSPPAPALRAYPSGLFQFKKVNADMSVEELDEMIRSVRKKQREQKALDAVLEKKKRDLDTQMADVLQRQQAITQQIQQVIQEREKLDRRIAEFQTRVLLVRQDELVGLKENARNIANLDPEIGRDLILSWWKQGTAGESRAVKTLSLMDHESVEAILETMDTDKIRTILDKRLTLVRVKAEGDNR